MWLLQLMRLALLLLFIAGPTAPLRAQPPLDSLAVFPGDAFGISNVTLVHLIASPERYDGQIVLASGYLHYRFEDSALYLSKEDADYLEAANAVWVTYAASCQVRLLPELEPRPCREAVGEADGQYVMLKGRFVAGRGGHFGMMYGSLVEVEAVSEKRRWYDGREELWEMGEDGALQRKEN
jgi:hypothetical protein